MICVSIAQPSRRFALADLVNAGSLCDLIELRLDRFEKAPDIKDFIAKKSKPLIMSCRRPQDGGDWKGSEEERLALLRQCIVNRAEYVEIELDVADKIRAFPPSKRVITYTNLRETPANLAEIYAEAQQKDADVIKLVTTARTPEEAWPLVQILARQTVPTVAIGLGKGSAMLALLGRKVGAPWAYAALERGMETYPGVPTVHELNAVYHYESIGKGTPLVAVTGTGEREHALIGALNAAFVHLASPLRCLPIQVGNLKLFRKMMDAVKLKGVVVDEPHQRNILDLVADSEPAARQVQAADLIVNSDKSWQGYNLIWRAAGAALENALRAKQPGDRPLHDKIVMVVGVNPMARAILLAIKQRGGVPVIATRHRAVGPVLAQEYKGRYVPLESMYSTPHEILIVCDHEPVAGKEQEADVHPSCLKPGNTLMDLTCLPRKSRLIGEAQLRGCNVVAPRQIMIEHAVLLLRLITGKEVPREPIEAALAELINDEAPAPAATFMR